jgi:ESS family glutamate:Na+ symporter
MDTPFAFDSLLAFGFLSILILAGVLLRARIPVFQRLLFPGCLLGGVLGFVLINTGLVIIPPERLEAIAYHLFNISFISVGLIPGTSRDKERKQGKSLLKGASWMALVQGITFPLQTLVGGALVLLFGLAGLKLFPTFGFLAPLGFNEGPGQALSIGKVWEGMGFQHAATIGLSFATLGYFFAFFVGVPLANRGIRKGRAAYGAKELPRDFLTGVLARNSTRESAGTLTVHSGNVDTLAFQAALVGLVYVLTYGLLRAVGSFLGADSAKMIWGFFFFFGLGMALLVRALMRGTGIEHLIDPGLQRRITGWAVDFLIVSTVVSIQAAIVWAYAVPILSIALANGLLTTLAVLRLGDRLESFGLERTLAIFGTVTGTVSCGLLLLRMVDPEFKTPVVVEIGLMNVFALPIVGGCSVLVNGPLWWDWSLGLTLLVFAGVLAAAWAVIRFVLNSRGRPDPS